VHSLHNVAQAVAGFGFAPAFLFGLLGSVHCFGMCGPLVSLYASQPVPPTAATIHRQLLLYNLGRVVVYADLGLLLGGAGWLLGIYPWASGAVGLLAGGFVTATGIHFLCSGNGSTWMDRALARPTQVLAGLWRKLAGLARSPGIIILGGLHGLLPCPLLYVMFSSAVAVQNPLQAGMLLLSFGLGTMPMMWGLGVAAHYLTPGKRAALQRAFGGLILLWGTVLLAHGIERFP
jgi:sulfite exporter TauE/SafE